MTPSLQRRTWYHDPGAIASATRGCNMSIKGGNTTASPGV